MISWLLNLKERTLGVRVAVLVVVVALAYLPAGAAACHFFGSDGLIASAAAALICLAGSGAALVAAERFRVNNQRLLGMLLGMMLRMGTPLALCACIVLSDATLARNGFWCCLAVFFEVTLLVEIFLSLPPAQSRKSPTGEATRDGLAT